MVLRAVVGGYAFFRFLRAIGIVVSAEGGASGDFTFGVVFRFFRDYGEDYSY